MERVYRVSLMFFKRGSDGVVQFILMKVADDMLFALSYETLKCFVDLIKERFNFSKVILDGTMNFN